MSQNILADNLRRLRLDKDYTQERLAEELEVSPQSISRWERGNTLPDVMLLPRIAKVYGVTVDDLFRERITAYPNYAQRLASVYEASRRTEDFLLAEQEFIRLLAGEHTADDLRSFGVIYHYMVKYCAARSETYLDAAIAKADPDHWVYSSAAQQKIALLCDLGRGREEAARYEQLLSSSPSDPMVWLLCVAAHHYAGLEEQAHALVTQALEKFPDHPALHVHGGNICKALGRYADAFAHWNRVLELDSSYMDPVYAMGLCYEELGQFDMAHRVWTGLHQQLLRQGLTQESRFTAQHIQICLERMT